MKVLFLFMLSLISLQSCTSSFAGGIKGSKDDDSREIPIKDYSVINISGSGDVIYEQKKGAPYLRVEVEEDLYKYLMVEVRENTLYIGWLNDREPSEYEIYTNSRSLTGVKILGSADVELKGTINTEDLHIQLFGSGDLSADDLRCNNLLVNILGSGDISLNGSANNYDAHISGSGDIDTSNLKSKNVKCTISGSGDIEVYASESLDAVISGSGDISYSGSPKRINKTVSGSGEITSE